MKATGYGVMAGLCVCASAYLTVHGKLGWAEYGLALMAWSCLLFTDNK